VTQREFTDRIGISVDTLRNCGRLTWRGANIAIIAITGGSMAAITIRNRDDALKARL
jgi:hypothetical protein